MALNHEGSPFLVLICSTSVLVYFTIARQPGPLALISNSGLDVKQSMYGKLMLNIPLRREFVCRGWIECAIYSLKGVIRFMTVLLII